MADAMDTEGHIPSTTRETIPKIESSTKFPQQRLRHDISRFTLADGNDDAEFGNFELSCSLAELKDDYGSYAPITPTNASEVNSSKAIYQISSKLWLDSSNRSESVGVIESKSSNLFGLRPSKVSKITKILRKRIEIESKKRLSAVVSPGYTSKHGTDSLSCNSDAETKIWSNLTGPCVGTDVSSADRELNETEAWNYLASTFVGKEESSVEGTEVYTTNSFCETEDFNEPVNAVRLKSNILTTITCPNGEVELLYSPAAVTTKKIGTQAAASSPDSSLSSSSRSSTTYASSSSKGSDSSNSSQGILLPPKRAIGGYDAFGNSDFSYPGAVRPHRRVHFSNMSKLNGTSALDSLMKVQTDGALSSDRSDDSSTSLEYLVNWCGIPGDLEEV